ncbi:MAG: hypothetical protein ABF636_05085 [Acetobacter sp.]
MTGRFFALLLGATMLATPAFAQESGTAPAAPTAGSAAAQVGQTPPAALDENGKRVEPSQKLWNNPRTQAEQPGTQPPANDRPANTADTIKPSLTGPQAVQPGKHKASKHTHHKTTPTDTQPQN